MSDHARRWWTHWLTCPACRRYSVRDLCAEGLWLYSDYQWEVEDRALDAVGGPGASDASRRG